MKTNQEFEKPVVGLDIPAMPGMHVSEVATPALIIDLDAFEKNVATLRQFIEQSGMRLRAHAKTHKSIDIARYQMDAGGACGICCQKVSEAAVMVAGGIRDILVSNQVVSKDKICLLVELAKKARMLVCVDNPDNVSDLSVESAARDATIECLVEINCGAGRCGVTHPQEALVLAQKINLSPGLRFAGLQSYQGAAQHIQDYSVRKEKIESAIDLTARVVQLLRENNLECDIVAGAGTGSYQFESMSGVYNELQCGSYIFMDADYQTVLDQNGKVISEFENSLFILTSVMSKTRVDQAICDAGLKAQSGDSGLPRVFGREDVEYIKCSDEHGVLSDPDNRLQLNDRLKLIPGHCDPTCNVHDWYVGIRNDRVECLWPVSARGKVY